MNDLALFIYTETSLHAGTGSTISAVDLPIQRERTTNHPVVQGSGVKGALRSSLSDSAKADPKEKTLFGPSPDDMKALRGQNNQTYAGALSVGDARIVLFPVRALKGVFAWITCPMVLARMKRVLPHMSIIAQTVPENGALVGSNCSVKIDTDVVLEEFSYPATEPKNSEGGNEVDLLAKWLVSNALPAGDEFKFWRSRLPHHLVILSDDDFTEFTINSTEIATRVRLLPGSKTVATGQLWTEESLPAETLLMSGINLTTPRDKSTASVSDLATWIQSDDTLPSRIQIGGDETTGQGFVSLRWHQPSVVATSQGATNNA